jgi:hydroxypyruvate isomerase
MLRFDVNVSILFREHPFLERFERSARLGFGAVEFWWPGGEDLKEVARRIRVADLEVVLMNLDAGDMAAGDRGLLNDPARQAQLRANVPVAIELAEQVGCRRLNALAGHWRPDEDRASQLAFVRENVEWIAERAAAAGITVMIEAVNSLQNGAYLFTTTRDALRFIDSLHAKNVAYQYDIYHMQRMEGNVVATLRDNIGRIGHIQIADSPDRHEPGTGELNYRYIFAALDATGYDGFVGLEYLPKGRSEESFGWLPPDRRNRVALGSLRL